jgi:hypothetical protein
MDVQAEKIDLITWLSQLNDVSIINEIKVLKQKSQDDWWDSLSEQQKNDIETGLTDLRLGRKRGIAEVLEKYKQ